MITKKEAQQLVYERINEPDEYWPDRPELVILDDGTITKEYGWVFFYQSKKYLETNDYRDCLAGNSPYIVNKYSGELVQTGTARPIDHYLRQYECNLRFLRVVEFFRKLKNL